MERMTAAKYRFIMQGKVNRAQGQHFENPISASCVHYKLERIAYIEKTPEPMKIIGVIDKIRGHFKAVFEKTAQPDYKGTLNGGWAIAFEAKHTDTDRIMQNAVTEEQWKALDLHEAMGAWCFVVVSLGLKFYKVPWEKWKTMKADCGHKYMNAADLESYEISYMNGVLQFL